MNTPGIKFYNLRQVMENIWQVNKDVDLVFSEGDEERYGAGWYIQKYPGGLCSQLFKSDMEAVKSFKEGKCTFPEK
jgi:hypothetical protein